MAAECIVSVVKTVGGSLFSVAMTVGGPLFSVAMPELSYVWNCSENVEKVRHEAENVKVMRGRVQELIDIAIYNGDKLSYGVEDWVKEADTQVSKADEFLQQEANATSVGLCAGNWVTLHRYSKSATKMAHSLLEHKTSGTDFVTCVSVETHPPTQLDVYQKKNLDGIDTQNEALDDIIAALEDETKQIIGIYGLGGVGKTTLAKEVVARVKNSLMFAHFGFTTVSQIVNAEKIKKDLERATKRIVKGEKVLIILDDVWEKLDVEELCIPFGSNYKNCKILLTSRSEKVCQHMNAQSKICVNSLPLKETWILFKRVVGERLDTEASLKPIAEEVAKKCGGLPLLIQAVGNALKDESIKSWESALNQLQKHAPMDIDEGIRKSFIQLKLSYDYLKSEDAKSCFLLCSLFPEDHNVALEDLVIYGVGLGKFDLDSIEDARGRVRNAVNILTSSCLLLNSNNEGRTKMHDVVRDVALLIASQGNNKFLVKSGLGLTEWPLPRNTSLQSYAGISLMYNKISELPDYKVSVPHLEIFLVCGNRKLPMISDEFIGSMKNVKVLDISLNNISSLPQSFHLLTKLRTLDLRGNKSLNEISIFGKMKEIEILILNETGISEIPREIAHLVNLRVLQVKDCEYLSQIPQGVISALSRLEELCIEFKLKFKGASDCIVEVMGLSKLTYLHLTVPSIDDIPAQCFNSSKLKRFVIQIGEYSLRDRYDLVNLSRLDRDLILSRLNLRIPLVKWLKILIEGSRPSMILEGIENIYNIMPTLYDEGFNKLEHIGLVNCQNVSCLVDEGKTDEKFFKKLKHLELEDLDKLEVIWKCADEYVSLTNLVTLSIYSCNKLDRVFTLRVAQTLVNLKYLQIKHCTRIEEVIWEGGDESGNIVAFPSLATVRLLLLSNLKSFLNSAVGNCRIIKYPYLVDVEIYKCKSMKKWGPGIHETPNLKTLKLNPGEIALHGPCAINEVMEMRFKFDEVVERFVERVVERVVGRAYREYRNIIRPMMNLANNDR